MTQLEERVKAVSRRLRDLAEPIAGCVYFAKEPQDNYAALGLDDYAQGYFPSRGACLGSPSGRLITAAFGVFNPDIVLPAVDAAWKKTTPEQILAARENGAATALRRMLPDSEDVDRAVRLLRSTMESCDYAGRPLFAGLLSLPFPSDRFGALWRVCDYVRERRGDGHIAAWVSHGCDAVEISLLTELAWGIPPKSYIFTRGWTAEQVDAGVARLEAKGYVADGAFTDSGREYRRSIESATDAGEAVVVEALGDKADELFALLEPLQQAVLEAKGYPVNPASTMNRDE